MHNTLAYHDNGSSIWYKWERSSMNAKELRRHATIVESWLTFTDESGGGYDGLHLVSDVILTKNTVLRSQTSLSRDNFDVMHTDTYRCHARAWCAFICTHYSPGKRREAYGPGTHLRIPSSTLPTGKPS